MQIIEKAKDISIVQVLGEFPHNYSSFNHRISPLVDTLARKIELLSGCHRLKDFLKFFKDLVSLNLLYQLFELS